MHRQNKNAMYRDPICYISDVEVMTGKSNTTAKRIYARARKYFGIGARERITIQQMQEYLVKI